MIWTVRANSIYTVKGMSASEIFVLSREARRHRNDVKHVVWSPDTNEVFSTSRDHTAMSHHVPAVQEGEGSDGRMPQGFTFQGHQGFVNFVMLHPGVPLLDGEVAVITGSNDHHVIVWSTQTSDMEAILDAHSEGVRCGVVLPRSEHNTGGDFITGGWDKICVVWDGVTGRAKQVFDGHKSSVLSIAFLPDTNWIVSGSGDKSVIVWDATTAVTYHTYTGHLDSVQSVVALSSDVFASAGNDGTIILWSVAGKSQVMMIPGAHDNIIYSLAWSAAAQTLFSASEDRTVRVWRNLLAPLDEAMPSPAQVILHPCVVWSVAVNELTGDIATGGSDACVRVWTTDADTKLAPIEMLEALDVAVSSTLVDIKAASAAATSAQLDVSKMPFVEEMHNFKGSREGEQKFFRNGGLVEVYLWTQGSWSKVGVVVAGPERTPYTGAPIPKEKKLYRGKAYDYLFDVEIEKQALKLPYNSGQNIYDAAQDFINEYGHLGISQESKEAIVKHILTLIDPQDAALIGAGSATASLSSDAAFSEFAREAAALKAKGAQQAQSWGEAKSRIEASGEEVAYSTFAQEGKALAARQASTQQQQGAGGATSSMSSATPEFFPAFNASGAKTKIRELTSCEDYDSLVDIVATSSQATLTAQVLEDVSNTIVALFASLPSGSTFPAIDLLRMIFASPHLSSSTAFAETFPIAASATEMFLDAVSQPTAADLERVVLLRLIANMFGRCAQGGSSVSYLVADFMSNAVAQFTPVVRTCLRGSPNAKAAALAVVGNAAIALQQIEKCADEQAASRLLEFVKVIIALIGEFLLYERNSDPSVPKVLLCCVTLVTPFLGAARWPQLSAHAKGLINQVLGPTLRMLKTGSDPQLKTLATTLLSTAE